MTHVRIVDRIIGRVKRTGEGTAAASTLACFLLESRGCADRDGDCLAPSPPAGIFTAVINTPLGQGQQQLPNRAKPASTGPARLHLRLETDDRSVAECTTVRIPAQSSS